MAATLGFHIIPARPGSALPAVMLIAGFTGLRRPGPAAMTSARRWPQA